MSYTLTESEAFDVANIVRNYAKEIRRDTEGVSDENLKRFLEDAALQREKLADRIEEAYT